MNNQEAEQETPSGVPCSSNVLRFLEREEIRKERIWQPVPEPLYSDADVDGYDAWKDEYREGQWG